MDRISGLSDELLIKILLFLPTKLAVSTSLLSKRWEFLWMWLPRLKYDSRYCRSETQGKMLQCFLERNLPLHRAPVIERLCLRLHDSYFRPEDVKLCVLTAVSHTIHEVKIGFISFQSGPSRLPSNLYTCKSLVILNLTGDILLDVPRLGCLASLKTLLLKYVKYFNEGSFRRLLSICPVLKDLLVCRSKYDQMGNCSVISRSLETLSIFIPGAFHLDGYVIDTPSLKHFKLEDNNQESHYCLVENMPMLIEAYVEVAFPDITSLIRSITSVMHLRICSKAMYGGRFVFNQLQNLFICARHEHSSNLLVQLLKDSPNLRLLELFTMDDHEEHMLYWNQPSTVPECLLSSLRHFIWSGYEGRPQERDLVVYILKNASHLETTKIFSNVFEVPKFEMIQELSLSPRASAMCQLEFK